jgi:nucleoside-diphosphate-sugar epimerase
MTFTNGQIAYSDICDGDALRSLVYGCDTVIHLAGPSSVAESFRRPSDYARAHTLGTAVLLELCREFRVRRLIYVSSAEVYGRPAKNPVTEDSPLAPLSPYGAVKLAAEWLVRSVCPIENIEAIIFRPFSVFGPRSPRSSVLGAILEQALAGQEVRLHNLKVVRDYCFVEDVARALTTAVQATLPDRLCVFNIATGQGTSVITLARTVLEILGRDLLIMAKDEADRPHTADVLALVGDPTWASLELNWRPQFDLRQGLEATVATWHRESP